jgi:glycosyltransferase involved in cell wall biosynthesis
MSAGSLRALISTVQPVSGGVSAKVRWLVQELASLNVNSTIAWYEPWSCSPSLSVPLPYVFAGRQVSFRRQDVWSSFQGEAIGSWLPEFEFPHYWPSGRWKDLINAADIHIAITGNPLCAHRFLASQVPFLAWIGAPWYDDRVDRVSHFPWPRRLLDRSFNSFFLRRMEKRVLRAPQGHILTISHHTATQLLKISKRPTAGVLYLPPDPEIFFPVPSARVPWRIGFAGRYGDPRKQLSLLLDAVVILRQHGLPVQLELTGEADGRNLIASDIRRRHLDEVVLCHPYLDHQNLALVIQKWDVFVIPSYQEGLCIAALEAMACGVPVVSTRCGGPSDFVLPGITGILVPHEPRAMAFAISTICNQPWYRRHLSHGALAWMASHADALEARRRLRSHLSVVFPALQLS